MKRKTEQESLSKNEKELKAEPKKKKITREDEIVPELKAHEEAESGILEKIVLSNFMCHKKLEVSFGTNVNFVIGRNGSGKSAILTAIIVGLGGKANITSRGNSLRGFIKEGCSACSVVITLRNQGTDAFKPEQYGSSIIVERKITADGSSSYKIKSKQNQVISTKKEELVAILDQFNIQIDNPVSILTQDTSRSFLNTSNEKDKYTATQLEQMTTDYQEIQQEKEILKETLKRKREVIPELYNQVKVFEEKYKDLQQLKDMEVKVQELKNELAWAMVRDKETEMLDVEQELIRYQAKVPNYKKHVSDTEDQIDLVQKAYDKNQKEINSFAEEVNVILNEKLQLESTQREIRNAFRQSQNTCKELESQIKQVKEDKDSLIKEIETIRNTAKRDVEFEQKQKEVLLSEKKHSLQQIQLQFNTTNHHMQQVTMEIRRKQEAKHKLQNDIRDAKKLVDNKRNDLQKLESNQRDRLSVFGRSTAAILNAINEAMTQGRFRKKPVGPLGSLIKLKDYAWVLAVEKCIVQVMPAYACDNGQDMLVLKEIFRQNCAREKYPSIIVSTFSEYIYDTSQSRPYPSTYPSVMDLLEFENNIVANTLIDQARVLPGERTLRMHYANCKSYNADFDGDEMNAHFPQNELGRSEAYNLVSTHYNYLSPKDGKPLAGLIQDHIVSGVWMTSRDKFFTREEYQQLIYNALIDSPSRVKTLPPCIRKPVPLWSGKQIFSSVLLNIIPDGWIPLNMIGNKAKLTDSNWAKDNSKLLGCSEKDPFLIEGQVVIRDGELMTGILDKTQYGSTQFGLVHCIYELYGGKISGLLLSVLARLFTAYLQHTGFSLGVEDILVIHKSEAKRREVIEEGKRCGNESAMEALNIEKREQLEECLQKAHYTNKGAELAQLDLSMKGRTDKITNKINNECINGLLKKFPENALQLMVQSGAKGSAVNCTQISCLLGQIELEGRRPPLTISGRSLPSFLPYDTNPRAGGFVDGRFLTGIRPQEYFFHCMAGREGLVDTAVKTSRSGYLQRCLVKHLEALYVQYDMTVRDGDGSVIQFLYGDDGIDVLQNQFLKKEQYKTIIQNYKAYERLLKPSEMKKYVNLTKALKMQKKCDRWRKRNGSPFSSLYSHLRMSPYNFFESEKKKKFKKRYPNSNIKKFTRAEVDLKLMEKWYSVQQSENKNQYFSKCLPCPDTVLSMYNPACYFGSVSENFQNDLNEFIRLNPDSILSDENDEENERKISADTFRPFMFAKYLRSVVHPGEAVGLLASQSIGEPSTQMTLNTFHFAGQSDMNVTLGIPRLREILMTASENIQTPQMDILVHSGKNEDAKKVCKHLNKVTLIQVMKHLSVFESLTRSSDERTLCRQFRIRIEFLPENVYSDNYETNPASIIKYVETVFIKKLCMTILKIMRDKEKQKTIESHTTRSLAVPAGDDDSANIPPDEPDDAADLSEDEFRDGDATSIKEMNRQKQFSSYDDPEERQEELEGTSKIFTTNIKRELMDFEEENEEELNPGNLAVNESDQKKKAGINVLHMDPRVANVLRRDRHVTGYLVDTQNQWFEVTLQFPLAGSKLMMTSIIEKLSQKSVVHEAPGISRSMIKESKIHGDSDRLRFKTEGVNIQELWKYPDVFDLNTLYSNNIQSIAKAYGIEAARSVLIKEVQDVFKVYGIQIDPRHLSMLGDYMTFEGVYKPFNRVGIESNSFPFQKMSFETSIHFLRSATAFGELDDLGSPSSRIVVGRVIGTGTGMIDLLPKITV